MKGIFNVDQDPNNLSLEDLKRLQKISKVLRSRYNLEIYGLLTNSSGKLFSRDILQSELGWERILIDNSLSELKDIHFVIENKGTLKANDNIHTTVTWLIKALISMTNP